MSKWKVKNTIVIILLFLIIISGICIMLYPTISHTINSLHQSRSISTYSEKVDEMGSEAYKAILRQARDYNQYLMDHSTLCQMTAQEKEMYRQCLNVDESGMMGFIEIPAIHVSLPIYHGTDDRVLQTAIGHLEGTSLPVGGESTHCVLSGHCGLLKAKLFTDLNQLKVGDGFFLRILNENMYYQVDQIQITEPTEKEPLQIVHGQDYCTLVTCTPYGINTHRLLVRGRRIMGDEQELQEKMEAEEKEQKRFKVFQDWMQRKGGKKVILLLILTILALFILRELTVLFANI